MSANANGETKHPAKFSRPIMHTMQQYLTRLAASQPDKKHWYVLDPMGGVGGVFDLHAIENDFPDPRVLHIMCVEIEIEWADVAEAHPRLSREDRVVCADFFTWCDRYLGSFDLIAVSPTYGNRMADHHDAKEDSVRNTYKHKLGRYLSDGSSAGMQWGDEYRRFHRKLWEEAWDLLEDGGFLLLNVKDHIRQGVKQPVSAWHRATMTSIGFKLVDVTDVAVSGNRQGENGNARVDHEQVYLFQKPWGKAMGNNNVAVDYANMSLFKGGAGIRKGDEKGDEKGVRKGVRKGDEKGDGDE